MAIRSAEGNDEERLPILHRRATGDEHLADLAVGGRADLGHVTEGLNPTKHLAAGDRIAAAPLARDAEDADGRRVNTLRLLGWSFLLPRGRCGRTRALPLPGDGDREAVRLDLARDRGEAP